MRLSPKRGGRGCRSLTSVREPPTLTPAMAPTVEVPPTICSDTCASAPNAVTICLPPGAPRTTGRSWPLADQGWQPALTCPHPTGQIGGQRELHASPKNKEQRGETVSSSRAGLCPLGSPRSPPLSPAGGIPHLHCLQNPKLLEVAPLLLLSDPKCHTLPGGGPLPPGTCWAAQCENIH